MASSIWTLASRAYSSSRAVSSALQLQRRTFLSLSAKHNINAVSIQKSTPSYARTESSFAATQQHLRSHLDSGAQTVPIDVSQPQSQPGTRPKPTTLSDLPEFLSLKGLISFETLKAITVKPFQLTHMTPVQAQVLPLLPDISFPYDPSTPTSQSDPPRDLLVRAKTGTGKTLAFLVPAIEARLQAIEQHTKRTVRDAGLSSDRHLEARARRAYVREHVGALIISPTRELATQIATEAVKLTQHHADFEVRLFVGGMSKRAQMRDWMRGRRDIVVTTPGRLRDLLESETEVVRGISKTQLLILDEADTLLDMGFREDIEAIKAFLPPVPERQTFLFSATVSPRVQQVARSTLSKSHRYIDCVSDNSSPVHAHVNQYHTVLPSAGHQIPHLLRLLAHDQLTNPGKSKTIVFFPTTKMTQLFATLLRELSRTSLPAGSNTQVYEIHSKRTQDSRISTSERFRADKSGASILVSSDVSARGVDYPGVTRVIQVGIPAGTEQYIHRVGRTGRAGTQGRGDLVLLPWEVGFVGWQLADVPLKPLTLHELTAQIKKHGARFDEDPEAFFAGVAPPSPPASSKFDFKGRAAKQNGGVVGPRMFNGPVVAVLDDIERNVGDILQKLDEDAVKETFASLLGYYITKTVELQTQKSVVMEGCRSWSVDACGLSSPPYVSDSFLTKIGYGEGRSNYSRKSWGSRERGGSGGGYGGRGSAAPWEGRGRQGRERSPPAWARADEGSEGEDLLVPARGRGRYENESGGGGYRGRDRDSGTSGGFRGGRGERGGFGEGRGRGGERGYAGRGERGFGGAPGRGGRDTGRFEDAGESGYGIGR